jgi:hypothetical protein
MANDDYGSPFDCADGDVYLRSADGVHFRVHKVLLSLSSLTFRDMLVAVDGEHDEQRNGLPVVPLLGAEEQATEVAGFLRIIYPFPSPHLDDLTLVRRVLEMGKKFQAEVIAAHFEAILPTHLLLKEGPVMCYALACIYRMENVARASALECVLRGNLDTLLAPEDELSSFRLLGGLEIYRLLDFRRRCIKALVSASHPHNVWEEWKQKIPLMHMMGDFVPMDGLVFLRKHPGDFSAEESSTCRCPKEATGTIYSMLKGGDYPREWWLIYLRECKDALRACPRPGVIRSVEIVGKALLAAGQCSTCRPQAVEHMRLFVDTFERLLQDALNSVSMPIACHQKT